ncbi:hypothetical protein ACFX19_044550 [Malus domestica]
MKTPSTTRNLQSKFGTCAVTDADVGGDGFGWCDWREVSRQRRERCTADSDNPVTYKLFPGFSTDGLLDLYLDLETDLEREPLYRFEDGE